MSTIFDLFDSTPVSSSGSFDRSATDIVPKKKPIDIFEMGKNDQKKEQPLSRFRSAENALYKGAAKEVREQIFKVPYFGKELKKLEGNPLVQNPESFQEKIETALPTKDEFLERGLESGGRNLPYVAIGGGGLGQSLIRSGASGLAKEGVKEMGGGEIPQTIAEIATLSGPDLLKKIIPTKGQKPIVDWARGKGMTEKQIAPLIQSEKKQRWLTKIARKGKRSDEALKQSREAVGNIYDRLKQSPSAQGRLNPDDLADFQENISKKLIQMPSAERELITKEFSDLQKTGFSGDGLINFYQDLNYLYKEGNKYAANLLSDVEKSMSTISPQLASDFKMTNQLYKNNAALSSKMRGSWAHDLIYYLGGAGKLITGVALHNYPLIVETLGESAGRRLATEMLINPRMQNLSLKMVQALNNGKYAIAKDLMDLILKKSDINQESIQEE